MSDPKSETKKHAQAAESEVDWAERLKASMNQSPDDSARSHKSGGSSTASAHEDDLAALLRAQLGKSSSSAATVDLPDTSDFEEAEEDYEEYEDEYDDEYDEEYDEENIDDENLPEEDYEDLPEEDYEDLPEEDYEDLPEEDYEDLPEADYEDLSEEDYEDLPEEDDEDIPEEDDEDLPEEDYEDISEDDESDEEDSYVDHGYGEIVDENLTKQILDKAFDEEFTLKNLDEYPQETEDDYAEWIRPTPPPPPPVSAPVISYSRPTADAWTDDRINGTPMQNGLIGNRLQDLARENQQLIQETGNLPDDRVERCEEEPPVAESPVEIAPVEDQPDTEPQPRPSAVSQIFIPLQLGLDDISPTVIPVSAEPEAPLDPVIPDAPHADYTDHMTEDLEEDALNDTDLYLKLGFEDTLRRTDDQMRVEELEAREEGKQHKHTSGEISSVRMEEEYRGREDSDQTEDAYLRARRRNTARLILAASGTLVGICYDLLPAILSCVDLHMSGIIPVYAPVGLVWTLLICLPFLTRLGRGIESLLEFEPTRYAIPAAALIVSVLHGIAACIVADPLNLPTFGGVALLMLTVAALAELLVTEGEYRAFAVASSGKTTHILTDEFTPAAAAAHDARGRHESNTVGKTVKSGKKVFTVVRAGRVADYFTRTKRYNPYMGRLNYLLPAALLIAIFCAGLEIALGGELLTDGIRVFTSTYLICLPSAYLVAMTLPLCTVNGHLAGKGTAVVGTASPVDYAGKENAELIFPDGDGLRALYRKDITLRGDARSDECRRLADVVFRLLQTPLAVDPVLRETSIEHYRIEISETDDQYMRLYLVDTELDNTTEIMMGSHMALTRRGVRLPKINMEQEYKKSEGSHVLYMAFNREFHLAYAVEYRVGRTFAHTVSALNDLGYEVSLSSFDPLVDPSMEGIQRLRKRGSMEILRPTHFESIRKARSSGLIATGKSLDLVHPLNACRAMLSVYRREYLFTWIGLGVGVALAVLAVCLGGEGFLISATVALWQLVGLGATLWISLASAGKKALLREPKKTPENSAVKDEQPASTAERRPVAVKDPLAAPRAAKKKPAKQKKSKRQKHKRKQR